MIVFLLFSFHWSRYGVNGALEMTFINYELWTELNHVASDKKLDLLAKSS